MLSKYFIIYLTLVFFATSLAVADHDDSMGNSAAEGRPTGEIQRELTYESDAASGEPLVDAVYEMNYGVTNMSGNQELAEKETKRRSTGEK